jgi:hypothetical protein
MLSRLDDHAARSSRPWLVLAVTASLIGATLLISWRQERWPGVPSQPSPHIFSSLPLSFEPNAAQSDPNARFMVRARGGNLFFTGNPVRDYATAKRADTARFAAFFHAMLERGVYLAPSQFEAAFVSTMHGAEEVEITMQVAHENFQRLSA